VGKVIALYLDSAGKLTAQISSAVAAGDPDGMRLAAHALKSSSGNVGATGLVEIARQLEALGREKQLDAAGPLMSRMADEYQRVVHALKARRAAA
jgi:HPt (histidine-containing phosphotransfer) domain-containing protein